MSDRSRTGGTTNRSITPAGRPLMTERNRERQRVEANQQRLQSDLDDQKERLTPGRNYFDGLHVSQLDTTFLQGRPLTKPMHTLRKNSPYSMFRNADIAQIKFDLDRQKARSP